MKGMLTGVHSPVHVCPASERSLERRVSLCPFLPEWARACQVYKLKAELARALDEELQQRANQGEVSFGAHFT